MAESFELPKPKWLEKDGFYSTLVIGGQWGDEAKGKIVYGLAKHHDVVVRYNGGHNAGHTLDNVILHIIPSGIQHEHTVNIMGQGMVISPAAFHKEWCDLEKSGTYISGEHLYISPKAHVILGHEVAFDLGGARKMVGTTGRGIGPTYEQRAARTGIRVIDLDDKKTLKKKLKRSLDSINIRLPEDGRLSIYDLEREVEQYGGLLTDYMGDVKAVLKEAKHKGKKFLFEGAQGALLDIDNGTYPNVTSSNTTRPSVGQMGYYIPITKALGVFKAPMSRVGKGPFPAEWGGPDNDREIRRFVEEERPLIAMKEKIARGEASEEEKRILENDKENLLKKLLEDIWEGSGPMPFLKVGAYFGWKGDEFGASTGRPRRLGPLDLVLAKYVVDINALDGLILTKWDVYSGAGPVPFVTEYEYAQEGLLKRTKDLTEFEFLELEKMLPAVINMKGWDENIQGEREWNNLPEQTKKCADMVEGHLKIPIEFFSTGPKKDHLIVRKVA